MSPVDLQTARSVVFPEPLLEPPDVGFDPFGFDPNLLAPGEIVDQEIHHVDDRRIGHFDTDLGFQKFDLPGLLEKPQMLIGPFFKPGWEGVHAV